MNTIHWSGYDWYLHPLWGIHHPENDFTWYDESTISVNSDDEVILDLKWNPKEFEMKDGTKKIIPWGRTCMRTVNEFDYGIFEWEMKLPYGKYQWPALWLSSDTEWPPEIDCMEGWSGNNPNFVKRLFFKNIKPTCHWSENCDSKNGKHIQYAKGNNFRWYVKGGSHFDKYKVIWTKDWIEVYYNKYKIYRFNDPDMLSHFNKENIKMHAIMSSGPYKGFTQKEYAEYIWHNQPMVVRKFTYTPLNV